MTPKTQSHATHGRRAGTHHWILLTLLVASVCINYIDRGNLSVAAELVRGELSLNGRQIGLLLSAFFWTYAAMQIPCGLLIDRYNVYWIFTAGFFLWSGATALTGVGRTFAGLLMLRAILGVAESVAYPAYSKILASGFAERQRGLANGLIDAGSKTGPALGLMIGGTVVAHFGWRAMFVGIGTLSMLWLLPWVFVIPRRPIDQPIDAQPHTAHYVPSLREIFRQRSAWGTFLGLIFSNYAWYFLLTWLPSYLIRERHYSMEKMATLGSIPFWTVAVSAVISGFAADRWIGSGGSPTVVRKTFAVTGLTLTTLVVPAAFVHSATVALVLLAAGGVAFGMYTANLWAITQTLAGPAAAGKWTGIQNGFGNLSGIAAPYITGWIVDKTGSFYYAFITVGVVLLLGAYSFLNIVKDVRPVTWTHAEGK